MNTKAQISSLSALGIRSGDRCPRTLVSTGNTHSTSITASRGIVGMVASVVGGGKVAVVCGKFGGGGGEAFIGGKPRFYSRHKPSPHYQ